MCNQSAVREAVEKYFLLAEKKLDQTFRRPSVRFTKRGRAAGEANCTTWDLNFNEVLLNENFDHFLVSTVPHEVAHLINHVLFPASHQAGFRKRRSPHGRTWKYVMYDVLGAPANRCHSYDTTNSRQKRTKKRFTYRCDCGATMELATGKHNKVQRGQASYSHRCSNPNPIYFTGEVKVI